MHMTIIEQKKLLRNFMLKKRLNFDPSEKRKYDEWICTSLEEIILEKNAKTVHAYIPMGAEINIKPLLERLIERGITVVTPKTLSKPEMQNRVLTSFDDLEKGVFGTSHPATPIEYKGKFDFIIVPGLAYDANNYRLGYGGGYYDTFLSKHPEAFKEGIFYPFQWVQEVPTEEHDVPLNEILVKP